MHARAHTRSNPKKKLSKIPFAACTSSKRRVFDVGLWFRSSETAFRGTFPFQPTHSLGRRPTRGPTRPPGPVCSVVAAPAHPGRPGGGGGTAARGPASHIVVRKAQETSPFHALVVVFLQVFHFCEIFLSSQKRRKKLCPNGALDCLSIARLRQG